MKVKKKIQVRAYTVYSPQDGNVKGRWLFTPFSIDAVFVYYKSLITRVLESLASFKFSVEYFVFSNVIIIIIINVIVIIMLLLCLVNRLEC